MTDTHRKMLVHLLIITVLAHIAPAVARTDKAQSDSLKLPALPKCQLLTADRIFDGINPPQSQQAVLLVGNKIKQIGPRNTLLGTCKNQLNLGDATLLPGFIESHAHITFQNIPHHIVLEHGITTAQDTGGPLQPPLGGQGTLRLLSTGPIIQAAGGYPLNMFGGDSGYDKVGYAVTSGAQAEDVVRHLVEGGASAIKIALEPGGENGAPWMQPHKGSVPATPWPILSLEITTAIVAKAHALNTKVIAHVGEATGFSRALDAKVDGLAHSPCAPIPDDLLQRAVNQGMVFITTLDTLSACVDSASHQGIHANTKRLAEKGAKFIYGSEIAHDNVPWGINGEELHLLMHLSSGAAIDDQDVLNVFKAATSKAGEFLGLAPLGTLVPDAPADLIAVRGNPFLRFKLLEYPDLVISGGRTIVNRFKKPTPL